MPIIEEQNLLNPPVQHLTSTVCKHITAGL